MKLQELKNTLQFISRVGIMFQQNNIDMCIVKTKSISFLLLILLYKVTKYEGKIFKILQPFKAKMKSQKMFIFNTKQDCSFQYVNMYNKQIPSANWDLIWKPDLIYFYWIVKPSLDNKGISNFVFEIKDKTKIENLSIQEKIRIESTTVVEYFYNKKLEEFTHRVLKENYNEIKNYQMNAIESKLMVKGGGRSSSRL